MDVLDHIPTPSQFPPSRRGDNFLIACTDTHVHCCISCLHCQRLLSSRIQSRGVGVAGAIQKLLYGWFCGICWQKCWTSCFLRFCNEIKWSTRSLNLGASGSLPAEMCALHKMCKCKCCVHVPSLSEIVVVLIRLTFCTYSYYGYRAQPFRNLVMAGQKYQYTKCRL